MQDTVENMHDKGSLVGMLATYIVFKINIYFEQCNIKVLLEQSRSVTFDLYYYHCLMYFVLDIFWSSLNPYI